MNTQLKTISRSSGKLESGSLLSRMYKHRMIYLLILPGLLYFLLFKVVPLWGLLLAFQDYNPFLGFTSSEWVGFKHFNELFGSSNFYIMLRNTLAINLIALVFHFPLPILMALMLNEIRHETFKRINQSIVYLPHFLSWVVVASMTFFLLSTDVGIVNKLIAQSGKDTISFLSEPNYFWGLLTAQSMWKEAGWGTIIFLAAMAGSILSVTKQRLWMAPDVSGRSGILPCQPFGQQLSFCSFYALGAWRIPVLNRSC